MFLIDGKGVQGISHHLWRHPGFVGSLHMLFFLSLYGAVSIIIIIIIMVLWPFFGPWPPFEFLDPIHSR
jgi:hypothetical protein